MKWLLIFCLSSCCRYAQPQKEWYKVPDPPNLYLFPLEHFYGNNLVMKSIYLAIPYSYNPEESFRIANEVAADLMQDGHLVFSPISHCHHLAQHLPETVRMDWSWWEKHDLPFVEKMDELHLVCIGKDGMKLIEQSTGVQAEIKHAQKHKKPIRIYVF